MGNKRLNQIELLASLFIFTVLIILPFASDGSEQISGSHPSQVDTTWEEINHEYIREDADPWDIQFVNATHGWALTQNRTGFGHGLISYSNDSGYTWCPQYFNQTAWLHQIELVNGRIWVASEGGLLLSDNDGQEWTFVPVGSKDDNFRCVHFFNESLGWAGSNLGIYRSEDGGITWLMIMDWTADDNPRRIHFITAEEGWIIGGFNIYHTNDGGVSWHIRHTMGGWTFSFVSDTEAWAVGDNMLTHMVDGKTWSDQPIPSGSMGRPPYFTDIYFLNRTHGWIGGSTPQIAHTQNGGIDWYQQSIPTVARINALCFFNESLGWAIGSDGRIFRTSQGSALGTHSWTTSNIGTILIIVAVVGVSIVIIWLRKRRSKKNAGPTTELT